MNDTVAKPVNLHPSGSEEALRPALDELANRSKGKRRNRLPTGEASNPGELITYSTLILASETIEF